MLVIVFEDQLISGKFRSPPIQMVDFVFLWQMSEMMFDRLYVEMKHGLNRLYATAKSYQTNQITKYSVKTEKMDS
jgi:hypothetical protein